MSRLIAINQTWNVQLREPIKQLSRFGFIFRSKVAVETFNFRMIFPEPNHFAMHWAFCFFALFLSLAIMDYDYAICKFVHIVAWLSWSTVRKLHVCFLPSPSFSKPLRHSSPRNSFDALFNGTTFISHNTVICIRRCFLSFSLYLSAWIWSLALSDDEASIWAVSAAVVGCQR